MRKEYSKEHYIMEYNDQLEEATTFWRTKQQRANANAKIRKLKKILEEKFKLKRWEY